MFNKIFKTIVLAISFSNVVFASGYWQNLRHFCVKEGWQAHMSIMAHDEESPSWIKGSVKEGDTNTKFNETLFNYIPNALADCETCQGFFTKKKENNDCILDFEGATPRDVTYTGANLNAWLFNNVIKFIYTKNLRKKIHDVSVESIGCKDEEALRYHSISRLSSSDGPVLAYKCKKALKILLQASGTSLVDEAEKLIRCYDNWCVVRNSGADQTTIQASKARYDRALSAFKSKYNTEITNFENYYFEVRSDDEIGKDDQYKIVELLKEVRKFAYKCPEVLKKTYTSDNLQLVDEAEKLIRCYDNWCVVRNSGADQTTIQASKARYDRALSAFKSKYNTVITNFENSGFAKNSRIDIEGEDAPSKIAQLLENVKEFAYRYSGFLKTYPSGDLRLVNEAEELIRCYDNWCMVRDSGANQITIQESKDQYASALSELKRKYEDAVINFENPYYLGSLNIKEEDQDKIAKILKMAKELTNKCPEVLKKTYPSGDLRLVNEAEKLIRCYDNWRVVRNSGADQTTIQAIKAQYDLALSEFEKKYENVMTNFENSDYAKYSCIEEDDSDKIAKILKIVKETENYKTEMNEEMDEDIKIFPNNLLEDTAKFDKALKLIEGYNRLASQYFSKESAENGFSEKDGEHAIELIGKLLQLRALIKYEYEFSDQQIANAVSDIKIYMKQLGLYKYIEKFHKIYEYSHIYSKFHLRIHGETDDDLKYMDQFIKDKKNKYEDKYPFVIDVNTLKEDRTFYLVGISNTGELRLFRTTLVKEGDKWVSAGYYVSDERSWKSGLYQFDMTTGTFNRCGNDDNDTYSDDFYDSNDQLYGKVVYPKMSDKPAWIDKCMKHLLGEEYYEKFWKNNSKNNKDLKWATPIKTPIVDNSEE